MFAIDFIARRRAALGWARRASLRMVRGACAILSLTLGALAAPLGLGCSASPARAAEGFSGQALLAMSSQGGAYQVSIRTSPQPPSRGQLSVEYTITSKETTAPAPGLALTVVPWMPAMGHGTSIVPSVTESSAGTYVVANVDLFMPGQWVLRTTISGASAEAGIATDAGLANDYVEPSFEIP